jgi:ATP-binding cassette, subfamily C (CFTR/MRP), member 1
MALQVQHATFQWEEVNADANDIWGKGRKQAKKAEKAKARNKDDTLRANPGGAAVAKDEQPFSLEGVNLEIPRGRLCAIVGPVGSGKSSLLSGLLGEMKQSSGTVVFGGNVAYCSQIAWIQNASVVSTT